MKFIFLTCLALAAPLAKRGLSEILNAVIEDFYYTNSDFTYEFIKLALTRIGDNLLDKLVLPENTTLTVALPPDSSLLSILSNSNSEIENFISYHAFYNQTVNYTKSASYQSAQGSFVKIAANATAKTTIALTSYDKPSLVLGSAYLIDGLVELLFLNDSLIVPATVYNTSVHYNWTNLTSFIKVASTQKEYVENVTTRIDVNATIPKETEISIPGYGTIVIPFGNTYLIPSELALQEFAKKNCSGTENRLLHFHTISNKTYFADSITNKTANVTASITAVSVNGTILFEGPFNSAKVIKGDILVDGGVGHVIDTVLLPFQNCTN